MKTLLNSFFLFGAHALVESNERFLVIEPCVHSMAINKQKNAISVILIVFAKIIRIYSPIAYPFQWQNKIKKWLNG